MSAIPSVALRKQLANDFITAVNTGTDSDEYYIGLGKSDQYNAADTIITPTQTYSEEREARNNLQSVKKIEAASLVVPRYNWTSGSIYSAYDDKTVGIPAQSYYVLTEDNQVYICLQQGKTATGVANTSTVKPSYTAAGVNLTKAFRTSDGYVWKYLYTITVTQSNSFLSSGFMPIERQIDSSGGLDGDARNQALVQEAATTGQIIGVAITNAGSGYSSAPTITFNGNGTSAAATATISGNSIAKIEMNNESAALGSGYEFASVSITGGGGSGAAARPIIGPVGGIGNDARNDLKASSIMLNIKPDGTVDGDFVVDNDFRQIVVMKNPNEIDSAGGDGTRFTDTSGRAMRFMTLADSAGLNTFTKGSTLTETSTGLRAFIDDIDLATKRLYFHQNLNIGFGAFGDGEPITDSDGGAGTTDSGDLHAIVNNHSGEILYIENRAAVTRNDAQQEDIKVIITA